MDSAPKALMGAGPSRLSSSEGDSDEQRAVGPSSSRAVSAPTSSARRRSRLARASHASGLKELDWPSKDPALFSKLKPATGNPWDFEHYRAVITPPRLYVPTHDRTDPPPHQVIKCQRTQVLVQELDKIRLKKDEKGKGKAKRPDGASPPETRRAKNLRLTRELTGTSHSAGTSPLRSPSNPFGPPMSPGDQTQSYDSHQ